MLNKLIVKKWLYQDQLNPVAELDSNNNVIMRFVYGTKINVPDYIVKGDSTYKVITDHLGSVRLVVNSVTGNVVQQIEYDEYGVVLSQTGSFDQPFAFAGGLYDEKTQLVRFGARDYDASIGRWTAKDQILFGGGVSNLFEYCVNDPVNYSDRYGYQTIKNDELRDIYNRLSDIEDILQLRLRDEQAAAEFQALIAQKQAEEQAKKRDDAIQRNKDLADEISKQLMDYYNQNECKNKGYNGQYRGFGQGGTEIGPLFHPGFFHAVDYINWLNNNPEAAQNIINGYLNYLKGLSNQ